MGAIDRAAEIGKLDLVIEHATRHGLWGVAVVAIIRRWHHARALEKEAA